MNQAQQEDIKNNRKVTTINFNETIIIITIPHCRAIEESKGHLITSNIMAVISMQTASSLRQWGGKERVLNTALGEMFKTKQTFFFQGFSM